MRGLGRLAGACGAVVAALVAPAAAGAWGTAVSSKTLATSTPFAPWGDPNLYFSVPGGTFEAGLAEWRTSGSARLVAGSRLDGAGRQVGAWTLRLDPGAVATARTVRVSGGEDSTRFFVRSATGAATRVHLHVTVTVQGSPNVAMMDVDIAVGSAWAPVRRLDLPIMYGADGTEDVELRLSANGGAGVLVDDVSIDPWKNR